jgi:hypothetical protein
VVLGIRLTTLTAFRVAAVTSCLASTNLHAADEPVTIPVPSGVELHAILGSAKSDPVRTVESGADLAVRRLEAGTGIDERQVIVVQNKGPGRAIGVGIELRPPTGLCLRSEPPCSNPEPWPNIQIVAGNCWEGDCRPCPAAPSPTGSPTRFECSVDLEVGEQFEFAVVGRYDWLTRPDHCNAPQFEISTLAAGPDPVAYNNVLRLDAVPVATAANVYFLPADGAVSTDRAITAGRLGQRLRLGVDLAPGACPSQPVVIALKFSDAEAQDEDPGRTVTARPVVDGAGRAVTAPFSLEELFWGRADGESIWDTGATPPRRTRLRDNHTVSAGQRLLPAPGSSLLASVGDRSSRLAIAAEPGSVELWLEAPGPTGDTRENRTVRHGEQVRVLLRTDPDSALSAEDRLSVFLTTSHEDSDLSTLETLDRVAPGLFALEFNAYYPAGTLIEVNHAYAPPAVDDRRRLRVTPSAVRVGLRQVADLSLPLDRVRPSRAVRAALVDDSHVSVTGDVVVIDVIVERDRRVIAQAPLQLRPWSRLPLGYFLSEPFALGEGPWSAAAVGDRVRIAAPKLDAAREYTIDEPLSAPSLQVFGADVDAPVERVLPGQVLRLVVDDRGETTGEGPVDVALRVLEGGRLKGE